MANFSISFTAGQINTGPDNVAAATSAPGAGDLEIRVSNTNITNRQEIIRFLIAAQQYFEDGRYDQLNIV